VQIVAIAPPSLAVLFSNKVPSMSILYENQGYIAPPDCSTFPRDQKVEFLIKASESLSKRPSKLFSKTEFMILFPQQLSELIIMAVKS